MNEVCGFCGLAIRPDEFMTEHISKETKKDLTAWEHSGSGDCYCAGFNPHRNNPPGYFTCVIQRNPRFAYPAGTEKYWEHLDD